MVTDIIKNYKFDFEKEAEQAFGTFTRIRKNTIFVNGASHPIEPIFGSEETIMHPALISLLKKVKKRIQEKKGSSETGVRIVNKNDWLYAINLNFENDTSSGIYPLDVDYVYTLDHELGHVLLNYLFMNNKNHIESAADAFAAIRHLQRFNNNTQALSLLSCSRSYNMAYLGRTEYMTTPVIDQILKDSKHIDFKALSPEETIETAKNYTRKYTLSYPEIAAANNWAKTTHAFLAHSPSNENFIKKIASTALSTPDHVSFKLGLSVIQPFLDTPEEVIIKNIHIQLDKKTREKLREQFTNRAQKLKLPEIVERLKEKVPASIITSKKHSYIRKTIHP